MMLSFLGVILKACSGRCFHLRSKGWCENVSESPPLASSRSIDMMGSKREQCFAAPKKSLN